MPRYNPQTEASYESSISLLSLYVRQVFYYDGARGNAGHIRLREYPQSRAAI